MELGDFWLGVGEDALPCFFAFWCESVAEYGFVIDCYLASGVWCVVAVFLTAREDCSIKAFEREYAFDGVVATGDCGDAKGKADVVSLGGFEEFMRCGSLACFI